MEYVGSREYKNNFWKKFFEENLKKIFYRKFSNGNLSLAENSGRDSGVDGLNFKVVNFKFSCFSFEIVSKKT